MITRENIDLDTLCGKVGDRVGSIFANVFLDNDERRWSYLL